MGRPRKSTSGRMLKIFSYPGDLNEFFQSLQLSLSNDGRTFSDYIVQLCLEDSKVRYPKLGAPELLKAIQESTGRSRPKKHDELSAAYSIKRIRDLIGRLSKAKPENEPGILHILKDECIRGAKVYDRTGSQELGALIDESSRILKSKGVI